MIEIEKKDESTSIGTIEPETQGTQGDSGSETENPEGSEYDSTTKITYAGKTSNSEFRRDGKRALDSGIFYPKDDVQK